MGIGKNNDWIAQIQSLETKKVIHLTVYVLVLAGIDMVLSDPYLVADEVFVDAATPFAMILGGNGVSWVMMTYWVVVVFVKYGNMRWPAIITENSYGAYLFHLFFLDTYIWLWTKIYNAVQEQNIEWNEKTAFQEAQSVPTQTPDGRVFWQSNLSNTVNLQTWDHQWGRWCGALFTIVLTVVSAWTFSQLVRMIPGVKRVL